MSGRFSATTNLQKECVIGISRRPAHGSGTPTTLLRKCRSASMTEMIDVGVFSVSDASRVNRSNDASAGLSISAVSRRARNRFGSIRAT